MGQKRVCVWGVVGGTLRLGVGHYLVWLLSAWHIGGWVKCGERDDSSQQLEMKSIKVDERKNSRQSQTKWELGNGKGTAEVSTGNSPAEPPHRAPWHRFLFLYSLKWLRSFVPCVSGSLPPQHRLRWRLCLYLAQCLQLPPDQSAFEVIDNCAQWYVLFLRKH